MGLFKNAKDAMGQANDAMAAAQQAQQQYGGAGAGGMADRGALESQGHEQNRILSVGAPGTAQIRGQALKDATALQAEAGALGALDPNSFAQTYIGGVPGSATVNAISDTGTMINNAPVCELDLTVTVPGREPYRVTHRQLLAQSVLARYQPGAVFSVRVDRNDPGKLVIG